MEREAGERGARDPLSSLLQISACANAVRTNPDAFACFLPCDYASWRPAALAPPRSSLATATPAARALAAAAAGHAADMAATHIFSHTGSSGSGAGERAAAAGFRSFPLGENIAAGYSSIASLVLAWACSPGHRANLLACGYDSVGTGVAVAAKGDGGSFAVYFSQDFGCARPDYDCVCPSSATGGRNASMPAVAPPACGVSGGGGEPAGALVARLSAPAAAPAPVATPAATVAPVIVPPKTTAPVAPADPPASARPAADAPPTPALPATQSTPPTPCLTCLYPLAMELAAAGVPATAAAAAALVAPRGCGRPPTTLAAATAAGTPLNVTLASLAGGGWLARVAHPEGFAGRVVVAAAPGASPLLTYEVVARPLVVSGSGVVEGNGGGRDEV